MLRRNLQRDTSYLLCDTVLCCAAHAYCCAKGMCACHENAGSELRNAPCPACCPLPSCQVSNLLLAGGLTHRWYKKHFRAYPKDRRAILPFIY